MSINTYKGRISVLGDSTTISSGNGSTTTYSYIEMEGGEMIKKFTAFMGIDGLVKTAFENQDLIELHVIDTLPGSPNLESVVLAIKRGDGKLYATSILRTPFLATILGPIFLFLVGIPTLFFFGAGLLLWLFAWKMYKNKTAYAAAGDYIRSLPDVVVI